MEPTLPPRTLGPEAIHALSNQLAVIIGFIEIILAETPEDNPHYQDLVEIQKAAAEASRLIGRPLKKS